MQDDVAQMQIAVAAAHRAGRHAARHQLDVRLQRRRHGLGQRLAGRRIEPVAGLAHLADVGRHRVAIVVGPAEARLIGASPSWKRGDARAQRRHQLGRQRAALGHAVEQAVLVEAMHDDQPVDGVVGRLADLAQRQLAVAPRRTGADAEIDLRRQLAVDLDLGRAHRGAPLDRREIHVGELHRALQLVGALAGEEDHGAVRVDAPGRRQMRFEEGDHLGLVLDDEGRLTAHASDGRRAQFAVVPADRRAG